MMKELRIGQTASITRTFTEEDVNRFAQITGDTNPVHLDEEYASTTRFGRRVAHGLLTAGLISALLGTELPGPGAIYLEQRLKFLKPVYLSDTVTATVEVIGYRPDKRLVTLKTTCSNQRGDEVLVGEAVLLAG